MASIEFSEERIARKILQKHALEVPFDLDKLVRQYANVIYKSIPISGVDGLSLNIKVVGKSPTVIINSSSPETRQRFTLAHELGHLIIPWHCGIDVEDLEDIDSIQAELASSFKYSEIEQEANRFAAEILMPRDFIEKIYRGDKKLADVHDEVCRLTGVSDQAAAIRLGQLLPRNIIYCSEQNGTILYSGVTTGTIATFPSHEIHNPDKIFPDAAEYSCHYAKGARIHWWKLDSKKSVVVEDDPRSWREILNEMTSHFESHEQPKIKSSVNAKIAYVNGHLKRNQPFDVDLLFTECYYRFLHDPQLEFLANHDDFKMFLSKKAADLNRN